MNSAQTSGRDDSDVSRWWLAAILAATAIVYSSSFGNGFVFDDGDIIVSNRLLGQWSYIWRSLSRDLWWSLDPGHLPQSSYYRPLENIWLALNFHLFGLNPAGWHVATVALHLIVV
ncbi:MAG TPA: hypothetical protein VMT58_08060, partial [Candidatus Binataceae bacterium]|nr:hypothetical protein [Candidatus Binataceae bacterium]